MRKLITILFLAAAAQACAAFGYYSPISINSAQVPSTQTDFPVLVSVTDARFKTVGNGGHVQNSSGFDIRPYSDTGLTTAITGYTLERYNATTGEVIMWVKVASLTSSSTPIYLAYGDSGISTDGTSTTTWSNHFLAVYLLRDGTTINVTDAKGSYNGTNHGATATTGVIDGGANVASASTQYIDLGTNLANQSIVTVSAWIKGTSFPNAYNVVTGFNNANTNYMFIYVKSNGKMAWSSQGASCDGAGSNTLSTGTSYYVTWKSGVASHSIGYLNAVQDCDAGVGSFPSVSCEADIGRDPVNGRYFNGMIDQVTYSDVTRSADWVTTEYNNQSSPGTFETLGTEVAVTTAATGNFFLLFP